MNSLYKLEQTYKSHKNLDIKEEEKPEQFYKDEFNYIIECFFDLDKFADLCHQMEEAFRGPLGEQLLRNQFDI